MAVLRHVGDARARALPTGCRTRPSCPASRTVAGVGAGRSRTGPGRPPSGRRRRARPCRRSRPRGRRTRRPGRPRRGRARSTSSSTSPTGDFDLREQRDRPADHVADEVGRRQLRCVGAVTTWRPSRKHRRRVAELEHLVEAVADEQHRHAAVARRRTIVNSRSTSWADSEAVGSSRIRTRASSDSALAISMSCWSAIDRPRTSADGSIRTSSPSKIAGGLAAHRPPVDGPKRPGRRVAHEDVLGDRQVREQPRLLVDDGDPELAGVGRPAEDDRARRRARPMPVSGLVDAGQDLDERALAGAVLADERVDLAGAQLQRHVGERLGRPEPLRDAAQGDGGGAAAGVAAGVARRSRRACGVTTARSTGADGGVAAARGRSPVDEADVDARPSSVVDHRRRARRRR